MGTHRRDTTVALVGLGFIGHLHLDALRRLGVDVVGVLGASPEETAPEAARLGVPHVYQDLEELAADERVDVVHIASPNHLHAAQARAVLAAGKHVVCEKPLALTGADGEAMVAAAADTGMVNAVCFHNRFFPVSAHVKGMIENGDIGAPRLVVGHYLQDWLASDRDWNWRVVPEFGGQTRALGDIGSHWIDLVEHVSGRRVVEVLGELRTFIPVRKRPVGRLETFAQAGDAQTEDVTIDTDDAALVLMRFDDGSSGSLTVSQVSPGRANHLRYEIAGSQASLAWESEHPEDLWIGRRSAPAELIRRDPTVMLPGAGGRYPAGHPEGLSEAFLGLFEAVYADVAAGAPGERPRYATFADGVRVSRIDEAILRSARSGTWTEVGDR